MNESGNAASAKSALNWLEMSLNENSFQFQRRIADVMMIFKMNLAFLHKLAPHEIRSKFQRMNSMNGGKSELCRRLLPTNYASIVADTDPISLLTLKNPKKSSRPACVNRPVTSELTDRIAFVNPPLILSSSKRQKLLFFPITNANPLLLTFNNNKSGKLPSN